MPTESGKLYTKRCIVSNIPRQVGLIYLQSSLLATPSKKVGNSLYLISIALKQQISINQSIANTN